MKCLDDSEKELLLDPEHTVSESRFDEISESKYAAFLAVFKNRTHELPSDPAPQTEFMSV